MAADRDHELYDTVLLHASAASPPPPHYLCSPTFQQRSSTFKPSEQVGFTAASFLLWMELLKFGRKVFSHLYLKIQVWRFLQFWGSGQKHGAVTCLEVGVSSFEVKWFYWVIVCLYRSVMMINPVGDSQRWESDKESLSGGRFDRQKSNDLTSDRSAVSPSLCRRLPQKTNPLKRQHGTHTLVLFALSFSLLSLLNCCTFNWVQSQCVRVDPVSCSCAYLQQEVTSGAWLKCDKMNRMHFRGIQEQDSV